MAMIEMPAYVGASVISSRAAEFARRFRARDPSFNCYSIAFDPFCDTFSNLKNFTRSFMT